MKLVLHAMISPAPAVVAVVAGITSAAGENTRVGPFSALRDVYPEWHDRTQG